MKEYEINVKGTPLSTSNINDLKCLISPGTTYTQLFKVRICEGLNSKSDAIKIFTRDGSAVQPATLSKDEYKVMMFTGYQCSDYPEAEVTEFTSPNAAIT